MAKLGGCRKLFAFALAVGLFIGLIFPASTPSHAAPGINQQMNFQGRLLNAQGATVPDGYYNIEFKIYQDGDGQTAGNTTGTPAGTLKWTESHLNANSQGVVVKNGFMSVQLGSVTPFGTSVDWDQDTLWLSMNIGGTNTTCTPFSSCTPDGEMVPMKRLSATPYALNAGQLGGRTSADFLHNTTSPQTANLNIQSAAANSVTAVIRGATSQTADILQAVTNAGTGLTVTSSGSTKIQVDSTDAFTIQSAAGSTLLGVDTVNRKLTVNQGSMVLTGFATPAAPTIAAASNQGGSLSGAAGTTYYYKVSALNGAGESVASAEASIASSSFTPIDAPGSAVSAADSGTAGNVSCDGTNGCKYVVTFVTANGETTSGIASAALLNVTSKTISLSSIPTGPTGTIERKVYRSTNGSAYALAVTITDNTATTATDNIASPSGSVPASNTARTNTNNATVTFGSVTGATSYRIYRGTSSNGQNNYQTASSSPFTDTGAAGTAGTVSTSDSSARLGVGTATPSEALEVGGNIALSQGGNRTIAVTDNTAADAAGYSLTLAAGGAEGSSIGNVGGQLILQGGNAAGTGNNNGGNITLSGGVGSGTGANGLVVLSTPTFSTTTNDANCYTAGTLVSASCTIALSSVNNSAAILVGFSQDGQTATLPAPTITTAGRVIYVSAADGSKDFTLKINSGGTGNEVAMRENTSATMIWNGTAWTAAGASSSTTLQAAYDNTLQSAGGAELVVSKTSATNGLTIRDSNVNAVNGTLLSIQTSSAAALLSVNSNVTEYASNAGAEIAGSSGLSTFPANTWSSMNGAAVTRYTTAGDFIATGQGSVSVATDTTADSGAKNTLSSPLTANTNYNVSFSARLASGIFTDMNVYYSVDGIAASVPCTVSQAVATSVWTKVNCTFKAPASGITTDNAVFIRQTASGTARSLYVDNLSVTIAADYNYASDGSVNDATNFTTNWSSVSGATVSHDSTVGHDASNSAKVVTTSAGQGVRNLLSINPLPGTLYRVTVYAASNTTGFNSFAVRYSRDGGTSFVNCADYNTQTISSSTTDFTKITCYILTDSTAATSPYMYFTQGDATGRTFYVDTHSMTLSSNSTPNVQIGGGVNGGPVTLLTLDRGASAPIASNNDALLGSMYYDTTLGKLQCYEADGWGACGSSPDNVVTISPEYTNAVMHGTGIGTMTADICSDALNINDGSSSQPVICGVNETFNFYKWTSPQATAQTYSIYVTYQLPSTFSGFASGQTSLIGRTDSSNAIVEYQVYRNSSTSGLNACGAAVAVSSGIASAWQTGIASGTADPSTCSFEPGDSIVFKINMTTSQNANAYVSNLNFTFNNK